MCVSSRIQKRALSHFQFGWLQVILGSRWSKYLSTAEEAEPESPPQEEAGSEARTQLCSSRYSWVCPHSRNVLFLETHFEGHVQTEKSKFS